MLDTLSPEPKSAVLDNVNPKNILAELSLFLNFCKSNKVSDDKIEFLIRYFISIEDRNLKWKKYQAQIQLFALLGRLGLTWRIC